MTATSGTHTTGKIVGIIANLLLVEVQDAVAQNAVCYIQHKPRPLMAEVIKVLGTRVYIQAFESTRGLRVGQTVEFREHMLEARLAPGILSRNYDGLQHDLNRMKGLFLQAGDYTDSYDKDALWAFEPLAKTGDRVQAADWLGEVPENSIPHKIMVPFKWRGSYTIKEIVPAGEYPVTKVIAKLEDEHGNMREVSMMQTWPVKVAMKTYSHKPRPSKLLPTGIRVIDTLNPMVEGGTGFVPGPFGSGKTVLQQAISKQASADVVIVAACGERANEVVDLFVEFPELEDPNTGRKLMERTIIIANTSNMPVAAREASVYTAMTLAEYYRAMGLKVLLLADSTSRWAQALREMSNRMEELPGPDAFPMDLPAIISNFYSRAGFVELHNGHTGSITFIGTVSPAGGNLKEPVTESTKKAARCFYALSQKRADSKRYPAIDPIDSYSKYLEYPELQKNLSAELGEDWVALVEKLKNYMLRGKEAAEQINILGDDSVSLDYHLRFWSSELIDAVLLQQDGFDPIDRNTPMKRQHYMLHRVMQICALQWNFDSFEQIAPYFKKLINLLRQMNYHPFESNNFDKLNHNVSELLNERS